MKYVLNFVIGQCCPLQSGPLVNVRNGSVISATAGTVRNCVLERL